MEKNRTMSLTIFLRVLVESYNKELSKTTLAVYTNKLQEIEANWSKVYDEILEQHKDFMPTLPQIMAVAKGDSGKVDLKLKAMVLVGDLEIHVAKYGYTQPEAAKAAAPPELYALIERLGGWSNACRQKFSDHTNYQLRDRAHDLLNQIQKDPEVLKLAQVQKELAQKQITARIDYKASLVGGVTKTPLDVRKLIDDTFKRKLERSESDIQDEIEPTKDNSIK